MVGISDHCNPENGTAIMFKDNQPTPSFVLVMAADNRLLHKFTEEEVGILEKEYIYPSFQQWGLNIIPDTKRYTQSGQTSISHLVMAADPDNEVVSSFLISDPFSFYWISLIGPDNNTYMKNEKGFNQILSTFEPASSIDARQLWSVE